MTSLWSGAGQVIRSNGVNTGATVWTADRDAGTKITSALHDVHDESIADTIERTLNLDGENSPDANISWGNFKITNLADATAATDAVNARTAQSQIAAYALTSGDGTNYTASFSPAIASLVAGMRVFLEFHIFNNGPCDIAINGLSAVGMRDFRGRNLPPKELQTNRVEEFFFNGTQFRMVRPPEAREGSVIASAVPVQSVSPEDGWLLCDGSAISRTDYQRLFDSLGVTFGSGDGSTTFNVPDLRGRVIAGQDDMGGTSANRLTNFSGGVDGDVFGATGGADTHTIGTSQMPAHTHTGTTGGAGNHRHEIRGRDGGDGGTAVNHLEIDNANANCIGVEESTSTKFDVLIGNSLNAMQNVADHTHTFTTASTGSGAAHNNVQPTIILNWLIKA